MSQTIEQVRGPLTAQLSEYIVGSDFDALPVDVVDCTKRVVLDTLGCMVLGSTLPGGSVVASYLRTTGVAGPATVIGASFKTSTAYAALVNGTASHSDELDASHLSWGHPASLSVAASLAVSETEGLGGRDFLNAVALSHDIGTRVFTAMGSRPAWLRTHHTHSSAPLSLGAAAAAARLIGLSQVQVQHALAIASMNVFSPAAFHDELRHMTKAMTHGQSAFAGVSGALLAREGLEANDRILEAPHGLIDAWSTDETDLSKLTAGLGEDFSITGTGFKYYSAGYPIHAPLHAALELVRDNAIAVDDIAALIVRMAPQSAEIVNDRAMPSISLRDMVALGVVLGKLDYEDAHDEIALERADVQRLRSVIRIEPDEALGRHRPERRCARVDIETSTETYQSREHIPPGHWELGGMPWDAVETKFRSLVDPRLGSEAAEQLVSVVHRLDDVSDLSELTELLVLS
ncbi:MAG: hypothetical protein JWR35_3261 [Marmoricola sp.]|nr:hypothetical protein [Marmoricola sp.]